MSEEEMVEGALEEWWFSYEEIVWVVGFVI